MRCSARSFGSASSSAARRRSSSGVFPRQRVEAAFQPPLDVRDDVHDVAVALDEETVGHLHRADLGDAADVVASEVEQHQMLGSFLRVGE